MFTALFCKNVLKCRIMYRKMQQKIGKCIKINVCEFLISSNSLKDTLGNIYFVFPTHFLLDYSTITVE